MLILPILLSSPFVIFAVVLARKAIRAFRRRRRWMEGSIRVDGEIVAFQNHPQTEGPDYLAPVVSYRDQSGQTRQFTSAVPRPPDLYEVGQTVPVRFMVADPATIELEREALGSTFVTYAVVAVILLVGGTLPFLQILIRMLR